ncbi:MAG: hypothetical protein FJY67_06195 [Calditrichaeota bacterium]|nr:hypothetical protein [Calditrichota bacterium]
MRSITTIGGSGLIRRNWFRGLMLASLAWTASLFAATPDTTLDTYKTPALLTSAGQAADVMIVRGLALRAEVETHYRPLATGDSLNGAKTIILVAGGSSKGLGAAKVDVRDEEKRIAGLVKAAEKAKVPVLVFHIGGEARRGALSDPFNRLAAEAGEAIVVVQGGDDDGFFRKIAVKRKVPYRVISRQAELVGLMKELFPSPPPPTQD